MTENPRGAERRAHVRRKLRSPAFMVLPGGKVVDVRTLDISAGGMGLLIGANPPKGTVFDLQMALPMRSDGHRKLRAKVEVMQSIYDGQDGGFKVGVRFVGLEPDDSAAIAAFLQS